MPHSSWTLEPVTFQSVKSKLVHKPRTDDKERLEHAFFAAISGVQTALGLISAVASDVGIGPPGLQTGLSGLLFVLDAIQKTSQNAADIEQLATRIQELSSILQKSQSERTLSTSIVARMDELSEAWNDDIAQLKQMASRHLMERLLHHSDDAKAISDHVQAITWSIQNLTVESMLAIEFTLDEHARFMKHAVAKIQSGIDAVGEKVDSGFQQLNSKLDIKDGRPPHVSLALFDCGDRVPCLDGTRTVIIDHIFHWIGQSGDGKSEAFSASAGAGDATASSRIFWINGSAGTGKTTIAYTIAKACHENKTLGASFFCSRDNADCSNPKLIFTTIAYQLGHFCPSFGAKVTQVLKSHPDIGYSDLSYQLEELIINPLRAVRKSFPSCVVVIDALDECKDDSTTSIILASLSRHVTQLSPLKILITSRPERNIIAGFESSALESATRRFVLHEVQLGVVQNDIESYLTAKLTAIRTFYHLPDSWPSTTEIQALSRLSFGLFIFAATSVKFIEDQNYGDPVGQLVKLLRDATAKVEGPSPHHCLDRLYMQVLTHAHPDISSDLAGRLKVIMGTIVLLRDPLSVRSLEHLLNMKSEDADSNGSPVRNTLLRLHSVVIVPEDDTQVIRLLHPSFFDFLIDRDRCLNPKLVVNTRAQHTLLVQGCLHVMRDLRRNMCKIGSLTMLNNEVDDLSARITRYIPPHLQYACRHWASHLTHAMVSDIVLDLLKEFCSEGLLYWVEVCSLLGDLRSLLLSLNIAQRALTNSTSKNMSDITTLLKDCERFVREFFPILSTSSLQVYHSALMFTPSETLFRERYGHELPLSRMSNGCEKMWNLCLRTMEGHSGSIHSVALSPDATRIISGSYDTTLRLWDAVSGAHLNTIKGHSNSIASVAFSPDGTRIVSGSHDNTLQLWGAVSGAHLNTLKGHSGSIQSVAFSQDGTRIVSGSCDKTLRLWDGASGVHLNTLEGHSDWVWSVAFSPNGTRIVSGSDDNTLRLWDAVRGAHLKTLKGHSGQIRSVAFSPDGTRIVSGSFDYTLRLWDAVGGVHISTLNGHSDRIQSVAFSPDGTRIVSGSYDETLRLWDAVSGAHLNTFRGHTHNIQSVAFSPDGTRIVSGSNDKTLRLWDAVSSVHLDTQKGDSDSIFSVAFSPDGARIMSTSVGGALRLWDAASGAHLNTLNGHSDSIWSAVFSPDGRHIVSGSDDKTLRLWDAARGVHLKTLKGHSDWVRPVTFSPDGTRIVSGSYDKTLRLWDTVSGVHLNTLEGHSRDIASVAFSPDGTRIVSGSSDYTLRLWDAVSGAHLHTLIGHYDSVESVAFSPDGTRIMSRDKGNALRLWDAVSGAHVETLERYSGPVTSAAFSSDWMGSIVPGSNGGGLWQWDAAGDPTENQRYFMEDGWIYLARSHKRLCWIPVACRGELASSGHRIALGTPDGRVVIIDFSGMRV